MALPLIHALGDQLAQDLSRAVTDAFVKTFEVSVRPGHYSVGEGSVSLSGDVSGICGFVQDKLEGTMIACFQMQSLKTLLPRVLGNDIALTHDILLDAVCELTNMIFGSIKTELNTRGHNVRFGMPSAVHGAGHFIGHMHDGRYMLMHFDIDGHAFQIHLALHRER